MEAWCRKCKTTADLVTLAVSIRAGSVLRREDVCYCVACAALDGLYCERHEQYKVFTLQAVSPTVGDMPIVSRACGDCVFEIFRQIEPARVLEWAALLRAHRGEDILQKFGGGLILGPYRTLTVEERAVYVMVLFSVVYGRRVDELVSTLARGSHPVQ